MSLAQEQLAAACRMLSSRLFATELNGAYSLCVEGGESFVRVGTNQVGILYPYTNSSPQSYLAIFIFFYALLLFYPFLRHGDYLPMTPYCYLTTFIVPPLPLFVLTTSPHWPCQRSTPTLFPPCPVIAILRNYSRHQTFHNCLPPLFSQY